MSYHNHEEANDALGWIVALIVILAVIVAGFVWARREVTPVPSVLDQYETFTLNCNLRTGECIKIK